MKLIKVKCIFSFLFFTILSFAQPPNVLFIAVDDLKPLLGCYGVEKVISPQIDRLASLGTVFLNSHCQQAVCGPSRASLLTGWRPDRTKVWDLKTRIRDINPDVVTLPQYFKEQGYEAVGIGKIFDPRSVKGQVKDDPVSWSRPYVQVPHNPDSEFEMLNSDFVRKVRKIKASQEINEKNWSKLRKKIGGIPAVEGSEDVEDEAYGDGQIAKISVELIEELAANTSRPFFLAVGFKKPHLPFVAPKKYFDLYDRDSFKIHPYQQMPESAPAIHFQDSWELKNGSYILPESWPPSEEYQKELIHGYYACISYIDAQVGKLLDALKKNGVEDNTIVILWGDHGWHLGDHGMWCKHTNYEQATRSPLIIKVPGGMTPGKSKTPVEFVDIYPTLCELAGLPISENLDGISLMPILKNPHTKVKEVAVSQYPRGGGNNKLMGYAYRDERYRYIEWKNKQGEIVFRELYDYEKDPLEKRNVIEDAEYEEALERLEGVALEALLSEKRYPPFVPIEVQWRDPDKIITYKSTPQGDLTLHTFLPPGWKETDKRATILFFHGGGWLSGSPKAFYRQSIYLASKGMVAFSAEYRIGRKHKTKPIQCVYDGKSAFRWIRGHADKLGVDPDRIVASGGSAGGHVAVSLAALRAVDEERYKISCIPNALVLFNPVLDTTSRGFGSQLVGDNPILLSPIDNLQGEQPPTIIFNGDSDPTVKSSL